MPRPKNSPRVIDLPADVVFEAVLGIDDEGRITAANAPACALLKTAVSELIGKTLLEATHLLALADLFQVAMRTGEAKETEVKLVGPPDRLVRVRLSPVRASFGGGALLALVDETEMVYLRTVRTDFVANVSHELRTPLASIRAMAETLLDGAMQDTEHGPRFLETIIRESDRLVRLSEDLLELSRAESGQREATQFDLARLVTEVAGRLFGQAERRHVSLTVHPAPPAFIEADQSGIDQVIFNLIENALKYTPSGGAVVVQVGEDLEKKFARFSVQDTGIGILSQDLPRIFERFWRADRARRFSLGEGGVGQVGGTGLGLAIVKHIVESHGGTISVESQLGQGAKFIVTLPLAIDGQTV